MTSTGTDRTACVGIGRLVSDIKYAVRCLRINTMTTKEIKAWVHLPLTDGFPYAIYKTKKEAYADCGTGGSTKCIKRATITYTT